MALASGAPCGWSRRMQTPSGAPQQPRQPIGRPRLIAARATGSGGSGGGGAAGYRPLVKICGVTNEADADAAAAAGANLIGMIMWPKAKRAVSDATAAAIAAAARRHGAQAVGVFVDEDAATIARRCKAAGIGVAQLHGDGARAALAEIPQDLQVVYVMHATPEGDILTQPPGAGRQPDWLLVDGQQGGSGQTFDWKNLRPPAGATRGWLLAGGLHPGNVAEAVATARPSGVDVSSGVCGPDGLLKDQSKVEAFVAEALGAVAVAK